MNPFPDGLDRIFSKYKKVLVCELNGTHRGNGQLWKLLRAEYLVPAMSYTKVQGVPFSTAELAQAIDNALHPN